MFGIGRKARKSQPTVKPYTGGCIDGLDEDFDSEGYAVGPVGTRRINSSEPYRNGRGEDIYAGRHEFGDCPCHG